MAIISSDLPEPGQPRGSEELDVLNLLALIVNTLNGGIDKANVGNRFLQLQTLADRKIAFGAGTITGNSTASQTASVSHGLGVVPVVVFAGSGDINMNASADTFSSSSFRFVYKHIDSTVWSTTLNYYWIAIG